MLSASRTGGFFSGSSSQVISTDLPVMGESTQGLGVQSRETYSFLCREGDNLARTSTILQAYGGNSHSRGSSERVEDVHIPRTPVIPLTILILEHDRLAVLLEEVDNVLVVVVVLHAEGVVHVVIVVPEVLAVRRLDLVVVVDFGRLVAAVRAEAGELDVNAGRHAGHEGCEEEQDEEFGHCCCWLDSIRVKRWEGLN